MLSHTHSWLLLASLALLSSCSTLPTTPEPPLPTPVGTPAELHQQHLAQQAQIDQFFLQARIGIQTGNKGSSGTIRWQHHATDDTISMLSPVAGTVARITANAEGVTLSQNDGTVLQAADAETLTQQQLGWRLPLRGLPDWALGRPTRHLVNSVEWDHIGRITRLEQDGWQIEYPEYMEAFGYRLPRKINLRNDKLTLKLIIERWNDITLAPLH